VGGEGKSNGKGVREGKGKEEEWDIEEGRAEGGEGREKGMGGERQKSITIFHLQMLAAMQLAREMTP
jgi:hypothetical protein